MKNDYTKLSNFAERVVKIALEIPSGRVTTYGRIARASGGGTMASRSVTNILGKAYTNGLKNIPFHRIVYSNGKVWLNDKNKVKRLALYKKEGINLDKNNRIVNFSDILIEYN